MKPLSEKVKRLYETIPVFYRSTPQFDISGQIKQEYDAALNELKISMQTLIDAPQEVKDLFPEQEETSYLTDDIRKRIEMKEEAEKRKTIP